MAVMFFFAFVAMAVMFFFAFVAMAVMFFLAFVAVAVVLFLAFVAVAVMLFLAFVTVMVMFFGIADRRAVAVEVGHVVVVVLMGFIEDHIEITAGNARFLHAGNFNGESICRDGIHRSFQSVQVRPQIQHGGHKHISADAGGGF